MRNLALRWRREAQLIDTDPDLDLAPSESNDALRMLEDRAQSADLLSAFQELPERWQRVLWLAEVEQAPRSSIAEALRIKPNAVSALHRRARRGLRLQWLEQQVPESLREDRTHVARLLPAVLLEGRKARPSREISDHLRRCELCSECYSALREGPGAKHLPTLAAAGAAVIVEVHLVSRAGVEPEQYAVDPAGSGEWVFDLRPTMRYDAAGSYEYRVWAFTETAASPVASGAFRVEPPVVAGFEGITELNLAEAQSTGIVFEVNGAANGTICLASPWTGQLAEVPLDDGGVAVRRIRLLSASAYYLTFRGCEGEHTGPPNEVIFDVVDPDVFGWGGYSGFGRKVTRSAQILRDAARARTVPLQRASASSRGGRGPRAHHDTSGRVRY